MPSNPKLEIKISSEEELAEKFTRSVHILNNLRYWGKLYREKGGSEYKKAKTKWEGKADEFLTELSVTKTHNQSHIKLVKTNQ